MAEEELNKIQEDEEVATTEQEDDASLGWGETIDAEGEVYVSPEELARQQAQKKKKRLILGISIPSVFLLIAILMIGLRFGPEILPDSHGLYYGSNGGFIPKEYYVRSYSESIVSNNLTIPSTHIGLPVTTIRGDSLRACSSVTTVTIQDGVETIAGGAFAFCRELTAVSIPDSVTSIDDYAFFNCTGLTTVTIGDGVTAIGKQVFYNCNELSDINYNGTLAQWNGIAKGESWDSKTPDYTVHCSDGELAKE